VNVIVTVSSVELVRTVVTTYSQVCKYARIEHNDISCIDVV